VPLPFFGSVDVITDRNDTTRSIARRDAAAARRQERRGQADADRRSAMSERFSEIKSKDAATMDMFKQMAKSRFG
jgi:hypothetical protein